MGNFPCLSVVVIKQFPVIVSFANSMDLGHSQYAPMGQLDPLFHTLCGLSE